jgi:macrolide transport system ATP-binding/permease protein
MTGQLALFPAFQLTLWTRYELNQTFAPTSPKRTSAATARPSTGRPASSHVPPQPDATSANKQVKAGAKGRGPRPGKTSNKLGYDFFGGRVQKQISRRVRNAQHRLDELTRTQVRKPPSPLRFSADLTAAPSTDKLALSLRHVRVDGRLDIGRLDVVTGDRLMISGSNGAGKSTLLHVLAGRLAPDNGEVRRARGVRVGLLEQDVFFAEPGKTARQLYSGSAPLADLGLVAPRDLDRPVGHLSVGQRRRLALAMLIGKPPDVLLLDRSASSRSSSRRCGPHREPS